MNRQPDSSLLVKHGLYRPWARQTLYATSDIRHSKLTLTPKWRNSTKRIPNSRYNIPWWQVRGHRAFSESFTIAYNDKVDLEIEECIMDTEQGTLIFKNIKDLYVGGSHCSKRSHV
jgi:hypothetical protein